MGPSTRDHPTKSSRPRIDGASLIDPALHNPSVMEMLHTELSRSLIGTSSLARTRHAQRWSDADVSFPSSPGNIKSSLIQNMSLIESLMWSITRSDAPLRPLPARVQVRVLVAGLRRAVPPPPRPMRSLATSQGRSLSELGSSSQ